MGYPLGHSISPALHNCIYKYYNIHAEYKLFETPPTNLCKLFEQIRLSDVRGVNVTIPYKESIIKYIDDVDNVSLGIKAVNTIVCSNGFLTGRNTDYIGFIKSLELNGADVHDKDIFIIGSGGAAKAVSYSLSVLGGNIHIFCRNKNHLTEEAFLSINKNVRLYYLKDLPDEMKAIKPYLAVNCTPVGMKGFSGCFDINESDISGNVSVLYDLVYNPMNTSFLELGRSCGCSTISGIDMLLFQAFESIEIWTGVSIDFKLGKAELERQGII